MDGAVDVDALWRSIGCGLTLARQSGSDLDDHPADVAAARGLEMVTPGKTQLLLDIDDEAGVGRLLEGLATLERNGYEFAVQKVVRSPGGRGAHVYVEMFREMTDAERIAWQACLGSDLTRELLSLLRIVWQYRMARPPTVLFEEKGGA